MEMTAEKIAQLISGEIEGSNQKTVSGFQGIENAQEGDLTYVESEKYVSFIQTTKASVIIVSKTLSLVNIRTDSTLIRCENPRMAIARLLTIYQEAQFKSDGISTDSKVDQTAKIGSDASIGAGTIVEYGTTVGNNAILRSGSYVGKNVTIGKNVHLHSGARILDGTVIGDNVTIQANAIIGGDGFGFVPNSENNYFKVPHVGNVIIEDHVEIGAGTCIDRATMGSTIIRKGVKLDNLIQIAHNAKTD